MLNKKCLLEVNAERNLLARKGIMLKLTQLNKHFADHNPKCVMKFMCTFKHTFYGNLPLH